ncbi:MAG: FAD-binding oxidoreductase, partial [Gammaproteobacteria bacterium]
MLAIVRIAREHRLPLVPSGGRTGLCGGAVATRGEVLVSMERMDRVLEFDPIDRSVTVQAGMLTAALQAFATGQGLFYPVDFASAGSSQIGGNIATNAGGIRVIRHGMSRQQVLGLVVVDGRGERLDLNRGLLKNNTGPDLQQLFIGSEGVLGIITEVTLRLQPAPRSASVLLFAVPDLPAVLTLLERFSNTFEINAFEFFSDKALAYVSRRLDRSAPLRRAPFYALVEVERGDSTSEAHLLAA